jgi:DNA-binding NarL/FixJ family response regulator
MMQRQSEAKEQEKVSILLVEDHEIVREGLKALLNSQADMEVIGEAGNGQAAIYRARDLKPAVIIMDVSMPQTNGLKATNEIKKALPESKILVFTRHADSGFVQQLFRAGASGYVLKQSNSSDLLRAIRIVAAGNTYLDPAVTAKVVTGYVGKQIAPALPTHSKLSEREEDVLKMIAWGYSNKEIAAQLDISVKTVEAHKANCMKKLDCHSRIDIVRYALLQGWLKED